ncbi:hypothetical protein [Reichenbachiella agariperforans]|uniref:hypothetical protein n=1 Tax=Reichenbachiella agariperforans TaxID=156994 RepID=UPI001C095CE5|nr:hypothetical protein [Reichenbachiella agariperforans]MBU2915954.1 hypothetical protein [Reichenbachiella agariperforans]
MYRNEEALIGEQENLKMRETTPHTPYIPPIPRASGQAESNKKVVPGLSGPDDYAAETSNFQSESKISEDSNEQQGMNKANEFNSSSKKEGNESQQSFENSQTLASSSKSDSSQEKNRKGPELIDCETSSNNLSIQEVQQMMHPDLLSHFKEELERTRRKGESISKFLDLAISANDDCKAGSSNNQQEIGKKVKSSRIGIVKNGREGNFKIIKQSIVTDLNYLEMSIACKILSHTENWIIRKDQIRRSLDMPQGKFNHGWKQLILKGYIDQKRVYGDWEITFYENPNENPKSPYFKPLS